MKRLSQSTGAVLPNDNSANDSDLQVIRPAILVHAGPEGTSAKFMSSDGPITFDAARIRSVVDVHNKRLEKLARDYGGIDKIPIGAYEPILDSHADNSNDRIIGRLTGPLEVKIMDVPKVGKNVPCAVAQGITFLGKETVERVKDGRIYHLSIGINEKDNSLGEASTVVQPAAPGAMLLTKKLGGSTQMAQNDTDRIKMAHTQRMSLLTQMKAEVGHATARLIQLQSNAKATEKKERVTSKLTRLASQGKIGRVAFKDIMENKLTKLTAMGDEQLDTALSLLEGLQADPIRTKLNAQFGSSAAGDVMEFGKALAAQKDQAAYRKLSAETKRDMIRMSGGKKLFAEKEDEDHVEHSHEMKHKMASGPHEEEIHPGKDEHVVPDQAGEHELGHLHAKLGHHLEAGDIEGAKKVHEAMAAHCCSPGKMKHMSEYSGDVKSEDYKAQMGAFQKDLDEVKTQMSRFAGMVQQMMGAEEEEGKHFGEISEEHEQVAG